LEQYQCYWNAIKPLLAAIEIRYEKFPTPIYNEIRAFNDHVASCYINDFKDDEQVKKAAVHIKRILLDCYKYLNVHYSDKINDFEKRSRNVDLTSVGDGEFYIVYKKKRQEVVKTLTNAKELERQDFETSLEYYEKAFVTFQTIENHIDKNLVALNRAKAKYKIRTIVSIVVPIVTFVGGCILTNNNETIWQWIVSLF
jgi:hypothetical protein